MKKLSILFLSILLVGCSVSTESFEAELKQKLETVSQWRAVSPDNRKHYYSYYIEPGVGRRKSEDSYSIFIKEDVEFVMNLNVPQILKENYYSGDTQERQVTEPEEFLFRIQGEYSDYEDVISKYQCDVYLKGNIYYLVMETRYMNFYTTGSRAEIMTVAGEMLKIARTISIKEEEIISHYSSKEVIEYEREQLQLFEVMIPENGRIDEMLANKQNTDEVGDVDVPYSSDDYDETGGKKEPESTEDEKETSENSGVENSDAHDAYE